MDIALQNDSVKMVMVILEKLKSVQDKYESGLNLIHDQQEQLTSSQHKITFLQNKIEHLEDEIQKMEMFARKEKEKFLILEKELLQCEEKLFITQTKHQNVTMLEKERDQLVQDNTFLSQNSSDLEKALNYYLYNENSKMNSKITEANQKGCQTENNYPLQKNIEDLRKKWIHLKAEQLNLKLIFSDQSKNINGFMTHLQMKILESNKSSNLLSSGEKNHDDRINIKEEQNTTELKYNSTCKERLMKCEKNLISFKKKFELLRKKSTKASNKIITQKYNKIKSKCLQQKRVIQKQKKVGRSILNQITKQVEQQERLRKKWKNTTEEIIQEFQIKIRTLHEDNCNLRRKYEDLHCIIDQVVEDD